MASSKVTPDQLKNLDYGLAIDDAFKDALKEHFHTAFVNAVEDGVDVAIGRFEHGLKIMEKVRDAAIALRPLNG